MKNKSTAKVKVLGEIDGEKIWRYETASERLLAEIEKNKTDKKKKHEKLSI